MDQIEALRQFYDHYDKANMPDDATLDELVKVNAGKEAEMWSSLYQHYDKANMPSKEDIGTLASYKNPYRTEEKKNPTSPVSGQPQGMASGVTPTGESAVPVQPQAPLETADDDLKMLAEKPTEELLYNYLQKNGLDIPVEGGTQEDIQAKAEMVKGAAKPLLLNLEKIRQGSGTPEEKYIQAQRLVAETAQGLGGGKNILNKVVRDEQLLRETDPQTFNRVIDQRMNETAVKTPLVEGWNPKDPQGSYRNKMLSQAAATAFEPNSDREREAILLTRLERLKSNPNADQTLLARYEDEVSSMRTARVSELTAQAEKEAQMIDYMEAHGEDPQRVADARSALKLVRDEIDGYLNPDKAAAAVYSASKDIQQAQGGTPIEKMKNHLSRIVHERNDLRSTISTGENVMGMVIPSSETQKRLGELESQIKVLTPIVMLNEGPKVSQVAEGAGGALARSFMANVLPDGWMERPVSEQQQGQAILQAFTQSGVDVSQYDPEKLDLLKEQSKGYGLGDPRMWTELLGGTAAYMIPASVGGAVTAPLKLDKAIRGMEWLGRAKGLVADAVESGAQYGVGGLFLPKYEEMTVASGALGGAFKNVAKGVLPFLDTKGQNVLLERLASGAGETAEEFGNTIAEVWKTHGMERFWKGMEERFPNLDETAKFAISTFAMGVAMGSGTAAGKEMMSQSQKAFDQAPSEQQAIMQDIIDKIKDEAVQVQQQGAEAVKEELSQGAQEPVSEQPVSTKKSAYDFDGTLFDNKAGKLTPLGEEVKKRIEAGEDITIVTARESGDTAEIEAALGIKGDRIQATGDEAQKGEVLDQLGIDRADYYDADKAKMDAIQSGVQPVSQKAVEPIDAGKFGDIELDESLFEDGNVSETRLTERLMPAQESAVQEPVQEEVPNEVTIENLDALSSEALDRIAKAGGITINRDTKESLQAALKKAKQDLLNAKNKAAKDLNQYIVNSIEFQLSMPIQSVGASLLMEYAAAKSGKSNNPELVKAVEKELGILKGDSPVVELNPTVTQEMPPVSEPKKDKLSPAQRRALEERAAKKAEKAKKALEKPAEERSVNETIDVLSSPEVPAEVKEEAKKADDARVEQAVNEIAPREKLSHKILKDEYGTTADDMTKGFAADLYTNPEYYADMDDKSSKESWKEIKRIKGNPEADVTIYRAVPKGVKAIEDGDWITLSKTYANLHGEHTMSESGFEVVSQKVKAKDVVWDGNDINEFAYFKSEATNEAETPIEQKPVEPESIVGKAVDFIYDGDDFTGTVLSESKDPVSGKEKYLVQIETDKGRVEKLYVQKGDIKAVKPAPTGGQKIKKAYDKWRDAWSAYNSLGAIYDPAEQAKKAKVVIDRTIDLGAALIEAGVTEFGEWNKRMTQIIGSAFTKGKSREVLFKQSKALAEKRVPESAKPTVSEDKPKDTDTKQEPVKEPKEEKKEEPKEKKESAKKSGTQKLLEKYMGLASDTMQESIKKKKLVLTEYSQADVVKQANDNVQRAIEQDNLQRMVTRLSNVNTGSIIEGDIAQVERGILAFTFGRMADEKRAEFQQAVKDGNMEAAKQAEKEASEYAEDMNSLMVAYSLVATAAGRTGAISQTVKMMAGFADVSALTRFHSAMQKATERMKGKDGKSLSKLFKDATDEINAIRKDYADGIANAVDQSLSNPNVSDKKPTKEKTFLGMTKKEIDTGWRKAMDDFMNPSGDKANTGLNLEAIFKFGSGAARLAFYTVAKGGYTLQKFTDILRKGNPSITDDQINELWNADFEGTKASDFAAQVNAEKNLSPFLPSQKKKPASEAAKELAEKRLKSKEAIRDYLTGKIDVNTLSDRLYEIGLDDEQVNGIFGLLNDKMEDLTKNALDGEFDHIKSRETKLLESMVPSVKKESTPDAKRKALNDTKARVREAIRNHLINPTGDLVDKIEKAGLSRDRAELLAAKIEADYENLSESAKDGLFDYIKSPETKAAEKAKAKEIAEANRFIPKPKPRQKTEAEKEAAKKAAELRAQVKETIRDHFLRKDPLPLKDKLLALGLNDTQADAVMEQVRKNAREIMGNALAGQLDSIKSNLSKAKERETKQQQKAADKLARPFTPPKKAVRRTTTEVLIDRLVDGEIGDNYIGGLVGHKFGLPAEPTPEQVADLRKAAQTLAAASSGSVYEQDAFRELGRQLSRMVPRTPLDEFSDIYMGLIYSSILGSPATWLANVWSVADHTVLGPIKGMVNPRNIAFTLQAMRDAALKGNFKPISLANPIARTFFKAYATSLTPVKMGLASGREGVTSQRYDETMSDQELIQSVPALEREPRTLFGKAVNTPIPLPIGKGRALNLNLYMHLWGKTINKILTGSDVATTSMYIDYNFMDAVREQAIKKGLSFGEALKLANEYKRADSPLRISARDQAVSEAEAMKNISGKMPSDNLVLLREIEIMREAFAKKIGLTEQERIGIEKAARLNTFTLKREGTVGQVSKKIGNIMDKMGAARFLLTPFWMFRQIPGNIGDAMIDGLPILNLARLASGGVFSRIDKKTGTSIVDAVGTRPWSKQVENMIFSNVLFGVAVLALSGLDDDDEFIVEADDPLTGKKVPHVNFGGFKLPLSLFPALAPALIFADNVADKNRKYNRMGEDFGAAEFLGAYASGMEELAAFYSEQTFMKGLEDLGRIITAITRLKDPNANKSKILQAIFTPYVRLGLSPLPTSQKSVEFVERFALPFQYTEDGWYGFMLKNAGLTFLSDGKAVDIGGVPVKRYNFDRMLPTGYLAGDENPNQDVLDWLVKHDVVVEGMKNETNHYFKPAAKGERPEYRLFTPSEFESFATRTGEIFMEEMRKYINGQPVKVSDEKTVDFDKRKTQKELGSKDQIIWAPTEDVGKIRQRARDRAESELFGEKIINKTKAEALVLGGE